MARLEAQKAICDSSEKDLHRKFMQREELEKQVRPEGGEQARKRSRMDDSLCEENDDRTVLYLPANKPRTKAEDALLGKRDDKSILYLTGAKSKTHLHKQLRVFLEEEEKVSEAGLLLNGEKKEEGIEEGVIENVDNIVAAQRENLIEDRIESQRIGEKGQIYNIQFPEPEPEIEEEDEESRRQRGKGNLEKWLQFLLENSPEGCDTNPQNVDDKETSRPDEIIRKLNLKYPVQNTEVSGLQEPQGIGEKVEEERVEEAVQQKDGGRSVEEKVEIEDKSTPIKNPPYKLLTAKNEANELGGGEVESRSRSRSSFAVLERKEQQKDGGRSEEERVEIENKSTPIKNPPYKLLAEKIEANELDGNEVEGRRSSSFAVQGRKQRRRKEKGLVRSESARVFRRIPSSPSLISGMKKGVDFIWRKKPSVIGDDDGYEERARRNSFIKSSIKTIKRAVKI